MQNALKLKKILKPYRLKQYRRNLFRSIASYSSRTGRPHNWRTLLFYTVHVYTYSFTKLVFFTQWGDLLECPSDQVLEDVFRYGGMYLPPYFFCHNTLFFQKILCCGKFVATHYFL